MIEWLTPKMVFLGGVGLFVGVVFAVAISFPWRRRRRLRQLAEAWGGTFSENDDFDLHSRAKPILDAGELIGVSVRVEHDDYIVELFDIHAGPGGIPQRTCARIEPKRNIRGQSRHIKVRAMEGTDRCRIRGADLDASERETVQNMSSDLRGILDVRIEKGAVWICSNGSYHPAAEWETLIERGPDVAQVLSHPDTIPP